MIYSPFTQFTVPLVWNCKLLTVSQSPCCDNIGIPISGLLEHSPGLESRESPKLCSSWSENESFNLERVTVDSVFLGGQLFLKTSDGSSQILIKTCNKAWGTPKCTSSNLEINLLAIPLVILLLSPTVGYRILTWTYQPTHASGFQPRARWLSDTLVQGWTMKQQLKTKQDKPWHLKYF